MLVPITHKYISDIYENFTDEVITYMPPCPAKEIRETENIVEGWIKQRTNKTGLIAFIADD